MRRSIQVIVAVSAIAALVLAVSSVQAQQNDAPPKAPVREFPPLISGPGSQDESMPVKSPSDLVPDDRPLTGIQQFTLGSEDFSHSYWVPGFQFAELAGSNNPGGTKPDQWGETSYFVGTMSMLKAWRHSRLMLNYTGGGALTNASGVPNSQYHQLGVTQQFQWARWQLLFLDQFSYLPTTAFGFGGATSLTTPGVGGSLGGNLPGLQPNMSPNQSLFNATGPQYNNSSSAQIAYTVSPRTSLTVAASFAIQRFAQSGNIESNDAILTAGYNYVLTRKDTLGIVYTYSALRFLGNPQAFNDHTPGIAYGRKITGRLGLQLFGGPEITIYRHPIGTTTNRVSGSGRATLVYQFPRTSVHLSYNHTLTNGSGVLAGADTDQVSVQLSRQMARRWQGNVDFGYARNGIIGNLAAPGRSQIYNSWYGTAGINHLVGRTTNFNLGYTVQHQDSNQAFCATTACGTSFLQHQISLGIQWHSRPFVIR
jgi:hypothetical protein